MWRSESLNPKPRGRFFWGVLVGLGPHTEISQNPQVFIERVLCRVQGLELRDSKPQTCLEP